MSQYVSRRLTGPICAFFDGTDLADKVGAGFLLITTDADGLPRPCMLSVGEVLAQGDSALRFALWSGTHTGQNLARGSSALFCFVYEQYVSYVHGHTRRLPAHTNEHLECFEMAVGEVNTDEHVGMPVTSGITFEVTTSDRQTVLSEWQRQIDQLRQAQ